MTREQLLEGIANAILEASDGYMSNPKIAQAVLDYISPIIERAIYAIEKSCEVPEDGQYYENEYSNKAISQLECFVVNGGGE